MGNRRSSLVAVDDHTTGHATSYTATEMQTMTEFLPDFIHPTHSTKDDQACILAHWENLFSQTTQGGTATAPSPMVTLFDGFYKHLFEIAPVVKPLFRSSMQVQGKALVRIIGSIKNMLQSPDLIESAAALAKRHVNYGIKLPYFNALGLALIRTLQSCSEELWTPEIEAAWKKVYVHVALIVLIELAKLDPSHRRRSSLLKSLVSHREKSQPELETGMNPHHGHGHGGQTPMDSNARCPMSGNRLGDVAPQACQPVPALSATATIPPAVAPEALAVVAAPRPTRPPSASMSQRVLGVFGMGASAKYQQPDP